MTTSRSGLATRSRLPVVAMLWIAGLVVAVLAVLVALYMAGRRQEAADATATAAGLDLALLEPSEEQASGTTTTPPRPPAVRLAETVVGAEAEGWALVPVPGDRLPRSVSLSRPARGRASVWSVEPGESADAPILTVLLRPGEGEGGAEGRASEANGAASEANGAASEASGQGASLGPLPSYHGAPHVLVVFHARQGGGSGEAGELPAVLGVVAERFDMPASP